ncbi:Fur family transcriptional regulator [Ferrimicrobium acidiphilum]|uniref:Fur family transcriptional regulator n=1 Tax=Ferrimicrobium acidiphilum TaxID=121039 RepID=A0ABV3Y481_9ACTN
MSGVQLIDRLRDRGWRLSAQRRAVAEVLEGDNLHLSAEEIYQRARGRLDEISQATVYNTLRELVAMQELRVVAVEDGVKRYDPNVAVAHHHLLCTSCQTLTDVHPIGGDCVALGAEERSGYIITGMEILFKGVCPQCRAAGIS